jgi:hypothetical protein
VVCEVNSPPKSFSFLRGWRGRGLGNRGVPIATVTKKVRKVKEDMVNLFPRPVFSSQIPPPPELFPYLALSLGSR